MKQFLFLGNWKMNMLPADVERFASAFLPRFTPHPDYPDCGFAPPFTSLETCREVFSAAPGIRLGVQNVHWLDSGAHTGEISAPMVKPFGVSFAICGHSERRQFYGETNTHVSLRAKAAIDAGLTAVVCIGETVIEFEAGNTEHVVKTMTIESIESLDTEDLPSLVIAYEPVWAIGTGLAATPESVERVHSQIRELLAYRFNAKAAAEVTILYGGSTKPDNIEPLVAQPNVDGALVGGASLDAEQFALLIERGRRAVAVKRG